MKMQSKHSARLKGTITVPGDKSISHRALILASQVIGKTDIIGLLEGEDVINTAKALNLLGVKTERKSPFHWTVQGVGVGGLSESTDILDMGNSGTGARLMMGLVAPYNFVTFFTGDASLRKRPMKRVMTPLMETGARFESREGGKFPLALHGTDNALPLDYTLPVASAQVKSAILLSALNIAGTTTVIEPIATRDHTERMMQYFGWQVNTEKRPGNAIAISLTGQQELPAKDRSITVPGDPSSAAFVAVAALIIPGSDVTINNVTINPLRIGLYDTLIEMGADITFENKRSNAGEEIADIHVKYSPLHAVTVPASRAPSMIDEFPILAVAAAFAKGKTVMQGLEELRVKESDRLQVIYDGLIACGVKAEIIGDTLTVLGDHTPPKGGAIIKTHYDHRIAMSFLVMGMASAEVIHIDDGSAINTSFPGFAELMNSIGGQIAIDAPHAKGKALHRNFTIAIDGPAASGKGTLARRLAQHLSIPYLDTGSIYRAVGFETYLLR